VLFPWRKATWLPSGAVTLLYALPLAAKPEAVKGLGPPAVNVHADPSDMGGLVQNNELLAPDWVNGDAGVSKPPPARSVGSASSTWTAAIKGVWSAGRRPKKRGVGLPAATVKPSVL